MVLSDNLSEKSLPYFVPNPLFVTMDQILGLKHVLTVAVDGAESPDTPSQPLVNGDCYRLLMGFMADHHGYVQGLWLYIETYLHPG